MVLLGDTHGILDPRVLDVAEEADLIVHTGDVGGPAVLEALDATRRPWQAVTGNNDTPAKWNDPQRLGELPPELRIELPGGPLVIEHGHRANPAKARHAVLRARHPDARAIAYGHSHRLVVDDAERPWVLNPGAAGRSRTFGGPSCLRLFAGVRGWRVETLRFPPLPR